MSLFWGEVRAQGPFFTLNLKITVTRLRRYKRNQILHKDKDKRKKTVSLCKAPIAFKVAKIWCPHKGRLLRRGRHFPQFFETLYNLLTANRGSAKSIGFQYPILVFYAESDSVNQKYPFICSLSPD